jgi:hypothetical protein
LIKKTNATNSDLLLRRIIFETHKYCNGDSLKYFVSIFLKRVANFILRKVSKYLQINFINKNFFEVKSKLTNSQNYYSLSGQDLFVNYLINNIHSKNYYVEIGAGWPIKINNTYLLEYKYNWVGISIDFDRKMVDNFNSIRKNECLFSDATKINYTDLFISKKMPYEIDYLSLDIDPAYQTLLVLALMPFNKYKFKVLTFEHDSYRNGNLIKIVSRLFLKNNGYFCAYKNVKANGFGKYEDWWIHPEFISQRNARDVAIKIKNLTN